MKVKAKNWLKHNGTWYKGGDVFEIATVEVDELREMIEMAETPVLTAEPEEASEFGEIVEEPEEASEVGEIVEEPPKRRGRKPKAEE